MPLYEYQCDTCGHRFEIIRKMSDTPPDCPKCGSAVHKLQSAPAFQFKGSGWYITDYARKGEAKSDAGERAKDSAREGAKEGKDGPKEGTGTESKDSGTKESKEAAAKTETKDTAKAPVDTAAKRPSI